MCPDHPQQAPAVPQPWRAEASREMRQAFAAALRSAASPILLLDYDGTLAPFREDKMQAYPYQGVSERLERIAGGLTQVVFISGRPVAELRQLLPLAVRCEVWGMHGREHALPGEDAVRLEPSPGQRKRLDAAQQVLEARGYGAALERKVGSVAVHWRRAAALPAGRERAEKDARQIFAEHDAMDRLALLPFDGGLELRTADRTKAHATEAVLTAADRDGFDPRAVAFLGDDVTDEDALQVVGSRGGLGLLVREESRASYARALLQPPGDLLYFFDEWLSIAAARAEHRKEDV